VFKLWFFAQLLWLHLVGSTVWILDFQYCKDEGSLSNQPAWCLSAVPNLYGHVQKLYWNQRFLNYYALKQVPNFFIAAPMILMSCSGIMYYFQNIKVATHQLYKSNSYHQLQLLPHILFWLIFLFISITNTHVQTITRFFSAVPALYWYAALVCQNAVSFNIGVWKAKAILMYFAFFGILGTFLFSNFYVWTWWNQFVISK